MLAYAEAEIIARRHVDGLPPLPLGFARRHTAGRRVRAGWYFDYGIDKVPPNLGGAGSGIGGAAGYLVGDDGQITVVSFPMLRALLKGATLPSAGD
jgi:hypothetical protein